MTYSSTLDLKGTIGGKIMRVYDATDVATDGSSTIATGMRKIYGAFPMNSSRAGAGGLKIAISSGTLTLTSETANDDFKIMVIGNR